jgi:hypothetical protein
LPESCGRKIRDLALPSPVARRRQPKPRSHDHGHAVHPFIALPVPHAHARAAYRVGRPYGRPHSASLSVIDPGPGSRKRPVDMASCASTAACRSAFRSVPCYLPVRHPGNTTCVTTARARPGSGDATSRGIASWSGGPPVSSRTWLHCPGQWPTSAAGLARTRWHSRAVCYQCVPGVVRFYDTNSLPRLVEDQGLTVVECNGGPGHVSVLARASCDRVRRQQPDLPGESGCSRLSAGSFPPGHKELARPAATAAIRTATAGLAQGPRWRRFPSPARQRYMNAWKTAR